MMGGFGKQLVAAVGKLLAVAAGFAIYYLGMSMVIVWMVYLILTYAHHSSGAALLFSVRTLLPLSVIVGIGVLF
jgi:hypothetical protein